MTISYSRLFDPAQLGGAAATIYTVPSTPSTSLLRGGRVRLVNTTGAAATATLYAVPASGSASAANAILNAKSIASNDYLDIDLPLMAAGATLQGFSGTANAITISALAGSIYS